MKRAYAQLTIKAIDGAENSRTFSGIATTPTPDRAGDIVMPKGASFQLPIPFLWQHNHDQPIGWVTEAKVTNAGIEIKGTVAEIPEDGVLKDRIDEAWQAMKYGLVKGLSIGFRPLKSARIEDTWSYEFQEWEWMELSAVTIPANSEANIQTIKSIDQKHRKAALGKSAMVVRLKSNSGVTEKKLNLTFKGTEMKTIAEQIASFEAKRSANVARMNEIMSKAAEEGRTLDETETEEYDGLDSEVKAVDAHIVRLKAHEATIVTKATPVTKEVGTEQKAASEARGGNGVITVRSNVEKGIAFTRYVKALAMARGNIPQALAIAEHNKGWMDTTPQVAQVLKSAVVAGDTTSAGWASELVYNQNLVNEFIEMLRPQTILGKMSGLVQVPFNVRMSGQNSGSTAYWVGQGKPIPVSKLGTTDVTLGIAKAAGLIVLTEELVRSSDPSAELLVRNDLIETIKTFMDVQFVDPNVAAVANVSPASITNGLTPVTPTGTNLAALRADVQTLFKNFIQANDDPTGCVWIMSPVTALSISMMQNALGQPEYPTLNMNGGTFFGLPVIVSNSANIPGSPDSGNMIILAKAGDILFADEGQVTIDASREASIQMLDNPTNDTTTPTPTSMVSMFQTNSVAIRAVRFVNWKKRRSTAVTYIKEAAYVA